MDNNLNLDYKSFLETKQYKNINKGLIIDKEIVHPLLFGWQNDIVRWACRKGCCAVFLDTGLGKTFIQLEWANGIWLGISESDTLQFTRARGENDEKHICPLQLGTIERCIKLYSNPGEMVLTPFGGIGSEAYMAIKLGRMATLIELKPEYFNTAIMNIKKALTTRNEDLFNYQPTGMLEGLHLIKQQIELDNGG